MIRKAVDSPTEFDKKTSYKLIMMKSKFILLPF